MRTGQPSLTIRHAGNAEQIDSARVPSDGRNSGNVAFGRYAKGPGIGS